MKLPEIMKRERTAKNSRMVVSATASNSDSPLELNFLADGVAYLNARTFDYDLEKYKTLLADAFTRIKSAGADKLIIDVRENGGGNSRLGNALIDMFNAKPYRTFANKWKRSVLFAETVKEDPLLYTNAEKYLAARPGEILLNEQEIINPSVNPLRFGGLVYVLSGEKTFSSGLMFLGLVKDNGLAKIFGEETNEPACHFGEVMRFKLPHSGLRAGVSVKSWVSPGGCKGTRVVVPDVLVKRSVVDYLSGRDTILETALKLIMKGQ
jgi:C-terminal processing protease CtpA/Prc